MRMWKLLRTILLLAALAWAGLTLASANLPGAWKALCQNTTSTQRWLLLLWFFLPSAAAQWLDTHGWLAVGARARSCGGFARLFYIRLAGEAVNVSTPVLPLGGEPVKAMLLRLHGGPTADPSAPLAAARLAMGVSQVVFVLAGVVVAGLRSPDRLSHLAHFALFPAVLGGILVAGTTLGILSPSPVRRRIADRVFVGPLRAVGHLAGGVLATCREQPRAMLVGLAWFFGGWMVVAGEFCVVAWVLGWPLGFLEALGMEALMGSICMATFFLPGNLGSQEAGLLWVSELFRSPGPLGPIMVVLRRLRELLWVGVGLLCLAVLGGIRPRVDRPEGWTS